jgi:DUF971 family protein
MIPKKVKQTGENELMVEWEDGHHGRHLMGTLRKYCPCAGCKSEIESNAGLVMLPILKPGQYELRAIQPVGNYALQLKWGDGHQTGIYTFDYLRQICECNECIKTTAE